MFGSAVPISECLHEFEAFEETMRKSLLFRLATYKNAFSLAFPMDDINSLIRNERLDLAGNELVKFFRHKYFTALGGLQNNKNGFSLIINIVIQ